MILAKEFNSASYIIFCTISRARTSIFIIYSVEIRTIFVPNISFFDSRNQILYVSWIYARCSHAYDHLTCIICKKIHVDISIRAGVAHSANFLPLTWKSGNPPRAKNAHFFVSFINFGVQYLNNAFMYS